MLTIFMFISSMVNIELSYEYCLERLMYGVIIFPQIEILLEKTANFDELMAAAAEEREAIEAEEQS